MRNDVDFPLCRTVEFCSTNEERGLESQLEMPLQSAEGFNRDAVCVEKWCGML